MRLKGRTYTKYLTRQPDCAIDVVTQPGRIDARRCLARHSRVIQDNVQVCYECNTYIELVRYVTGGGKERK